MKDNRLIVENIMAVSKHLRVNLLCHLGMVLHSNQGGLKLLYWVPRTLHDKC